MENNKYDYEKIFHIYTKYRFASFSNIMSYDNQIFKFKDKVNSYHKTLKEMERSLLPKKSDEPVEIFIKEDKKIKKYEEQSRSDQDEPQNKHFEEEKKKYEMKDPEYEEKVESKKQKVEDLANLKDNIKIDIDGIVQTFVNEKRIEEEKKLNIKKNEIDNKYAYTKLEFKYNDNENEFKNQCLNEINKIKLMT